MLLWRFCFASLLKRFSFLKVICQGKEFLQVFFEMKKISQDLPEGKILQVLQWRKFRKCFAEKREEFYKSFE